ncbi:MAG: linear amide C-N hydrolase, partial [Clostridia bacterium]|nr:linear amide C-N hydrolase [Clostridia bacterium]
HAAVRDLHAAAIDSAQPGLQKLATNLSFARVGDCGFSEFLEAGGASSDREVLAFLSGMLCAPGLDFQIPGAGCSTISAASPDGGHFFGRNFDWSCREVLLLEAHPDGGYASFSTVNVDFLKESASANLSDEALCAAAYYAPLDGMNEKGLCVSVNMISDSARIAQKSDLPDLTTTTALRLLLDRAATVDEALALLAGYDLHGSYDMMVHFAVADAEGKAADVEYVDQKMVVVETPILTNFYLAEGEKNGIGAAQSHERFKVLEAFLEEHPTASVYEIRDALKAAGESNFDPDPNERTEWSVIYDQKSLTATWYRRENFGEGWTAALAQ